MFGGCERIVGTRKDFLTTAGLAGGGLVAKADPKAPSPAAREFAQRMRRFDSSLTQSQLNDIEKGIDDLWKIGDKVHKGLVNADPTSPAFETGE